jgi:hypothetical protein
LIITLSNSVEEVGVLVGVPVAVGVLDAVGVFDGVGVSVAVEVEVGVAVGFPHVLIGLEEFCGSLGLRRKKSDALLLESMH